MMRGIKQGLEKLLSGALIAATVVSAPLAKATDSPPVPVRNIQLPPTGPNMAIGANINGVAMGSTNVFIDTGNSYNSINLAVSETYGAKINPKRPTSDDGSSVTNGYFFQSYSNMVHKINAATATVVRSWNVGGTNKALSGTFIINGNEYGTHIDQNSGGLDVFNYSTTLNSSNDVRRIGAFPTTSTKKITGGDSILHFNKLYSFGLYGDTFRVMVTDMSNPTFPTTSVPVEYRLTSSVTIAKLQDIAFRKDDSPQQNGLPPLPNSKYVGYVGASDLLGGSQFFSWNFDLRQFDPLQLAIARSNNTVKVSYSDVFTNVVIQIASPSNPTLWTDKTDGTSSVSGGYITREFPASSAGELIRARY